MELKPKTFEEQWAEALKDASETPPDIVWANIEKELGEKNKKRGLIFWLTNPRVISGIAAMLILGFGYLISTNSFFKNSSSTELASNNQDAKNANKIGNAGQRNSVKNAGSIQNKSDNLALKKSLDSKEIEIEKSKSSKYTSQEFNAERNNKNLAALKLIDEHRDNIFAKNKLDSRNSGNNLIRKNTLIANYNGSDNSVKVKEKNYEIAKSELNILDNKGNSLALGEANKLNQSTAREIIVIEKIALKSVKPYNNRFVTGRNKLSYENPEYFADNKKVKKNRFWVGVNSGAAPFNPNFSKGSFGSDALAAIQNESNNALAYKTTAGAPVAANGINGNVGLAAADMFYSKIPQNTVNKGRALNIGFNFGKKLSKKIGIESGLRIASATASINSNVYSINQNTGEINTFIQGNYLNLNDNATQTIISVDEVNSQLYNYLNIPVQLSYSLPIYNQISMDILGGLSGDVFLNGKFQGDNSSKSVVNAGNSNFRFLNISGIEGLRLNYRLKSKWQLNVGSFFQHALTSGVNRNSSITYKPRMFGVNYGLMYNLN
jgi:hypothetical protein